MNKILLDTNAYSHYLVGDEKVLNALANAEITYMSVFVLGELYAGFRGGNKEAQNIQQLRRFLQISNVSILDAVEETAEIFGEIKDSLKKAGTPLPINDIWIASHAIETGSVIISYDDHFKKIPNLRIWDQLH